jgi:uncharacterized membrane protein YqjE
MTATDLKLPTLGRLVRRTSATLLGAFQNRAELLAVELEEENDRLLKLVLFGVGALFLGMMTVLLLTGMIIFLVPPDYRVYAALGFTVLYLAGTIGSVLAAKGLLKRIPFSESLNQIKKDAELLDAFK